VSETGWIGWAARHAAFLFPRPVEGVPVRCAAGAPLLEPGKPVKLLGWNIQFAAGRHPFFYDYGDVVSVSAAEVQATLRGIEAVIRAADPDLVVLQEVDRGARRTAFIDEHAWLVEALGFPCHATTPYWRAPYVPIPRNEPLGRVDLHLTVMSRFALGPATRRALPLLRESTVRRLFNLKRALLEVRLPVRDGPDFTLLQTHLSAFSRGDGSLAAQVALVDERLAALEAGGAPWVLEGDLNALAPGDDAARLAPDERALYPEATTPVQPLVDHWHDPVGDGWRTDPERWRTFLPYPDEVPDRTLDYVFHGGAVRALDHRVVREATGWSDHLPLLFTFEVPG
jgi:endonuclease/exonuclease/phosphatase family metal-dependent hydrolase